MPLTLPVVLLFFRFGLVGVMMVGQPGLLVDPKKVLQKTST